jgi:hypothetical protein
MNHHPTNKQKYQHFERQQNLLAAMARKSESTPAKANNSILAKANTYDIDIDVGDTLPGLIELFILQYLLEILDNKKISKHNIMKARQLISQEMSEVPQSYLLIWTYMLLEQKNSS